MLHRPEDTLFFLHILTSLESGIYLTIDVVRKPQCSLINSIYIFFILNGTQRYILPAMQLGFDKILAGHDMVPFILNSMKGGSPYPYLWVG